MRTSRWRISKRWRSTWGPRMLAGTVALTSESSQMTGSSTGRDFAWSTLGQSTTTVPSSRSLWGTISELCLSQTKMEAGWLSPCGSPDWRKSSTKITQGRVELRIWSPGRSRDGPSKELESLRFNQRNFYIAEYRIFYNCRIPPTQEKKLLPPKNLVNSCDVVMTVPLFHISEYQIKVKQRSNQ